VRLGGNFFSDWVVMDIIELFLKIREALDRDIVKSAPPHFPREAADTFCLDAGICFEVVHKFGNIPIDRADKKMNVIRHDGEPGDLHMAAFDVKSHSFAERFAYRIINEHVSFPIGRESQKNIILRRNSCSSVFIHSLIVSRTCGSAQRGKFPAAIGTGF
jgi:hypothetical protein